jgi:exodeoxyribonuclease-3
MKAITWNVNSITVRLPRLLAMLARHQPDVVCLQELKAPAEKLPFDALRDAGYHMLAHGQKAYNGVAILARTPLKATAINFGAGNDDPQARMLAADVQGIQVICVYVPNGAAMGTDKCAYKLAWLQRLRHYLQHDVDATRPILVCGDFNVAPRAEDIAQPDRWQDSVLFHPQMRAALADITACGLIDVFATHHPAGGVYSWWDYRNLGFVKNNGLRIDLILATPGLAQRSVDAEVDRDERKGERPSDHAPVIATFQWP